MRMPRFTIRTILFGIILIALVVGIVAVTRENERLRRELADSRALHTASSAFLPSYVAVDLGTDEGLTVGADLSVYRAEARATVMPDGADAFVGTSAQPEAKP